MKPIRIFFLGGMYFIFNWVLKKTKQVFKGKTKYHQRLKNTKLSYCLWARNQSHSTPELSSVYLPGLKAEGVHYFLLEEILLITRNI